MSKATPGLRKRGNIWHIEKTIAGRKVHESTGETELGAAERYLAKRVAEIRAVLVYGERQTRTFDDAAAQYLEDFGHKRSLDRDIISIKAVMPHIGHMALDAIHAGTLAGFIQERKQAGIAAGTLNRDLAVVRRILNLCAKLWRDGQGRPWLAAAPMFVLQHGEPRKPRPITWAEQARLLQAMPGYLAEMALFALNTGLRDQELCGLQWDWEHQISGTTASVFIIPAAAAKNGRERIVPLNAIARSVIESRRGKNERWVFDWNGSRLSRMNNRAWRKAITEAGLPGVRVHDLRHTFGMRLRAMGVGYEDRQDLLGHHAGSVTTHYSKPEIMRLVEAVEVLCDSKEKPEITLIKRVATR